MRLAPLATLLALATLAPQATAPGQSAAPGLPEPIATRQTTFSIPFRIDRPADPAREPVEVRLLVSVDRGARWQVYSTVPPTQKYFLFQGSGDGEYWFVIQTLDRSGQLRPAAAGTPGLRVVVDTALPKLQLSAERGNAGQVTATWQIDEPLPRPNSLVLQYRTASGGAWQQVAVGSANRQAAGAVENGQVSWWPQTGTDALQIRMEVSDAAGNMAVSHAQVAAPEGRLASQTNSPGTATDPGATAEANPPGTAQPPASTNSLVGQRYADRYPETAGSAGDTSPWRAEKVETQGSAGGGAVQGQGSTMGYGPAATTGRRPESTSMQGPGTRATTTEAPGAAATMGLGQGATTGQGLEATSTHGPGTRATGAARPRMVNSRLFEVEYDVDSTMPTQIGQVELWGTRDGGRTWQSFCLDNDSRSPMLVSVDGEGLYGFRVVISNRSGNGGTPPQSGDPPAVTIGVDLTKPTARLLTANMGTGPEAGHLIITWEAVDPWLADQPITLAYSGSRAGPWTTIAAELENTGRYAWPLDERLPQNIHLRLEARDRAGNVGVFETNEPVTLSHVQPDVRIRDVRPVGSQASRAAVPDYRYYDQYPARPPQVTRRAPYGRSR